MKKYLLFFLIIFSGIFFALGGKVQAAFSSTPSFSDDFNSVNESVWQIGNWEEDGGGITSPARCYAQNGVLNLDFLNNNGTLLSSSIQTRAEFGYGKWEASLKPSSVAGVCNAMFTIDWLNDETGVDGDGSKQEIDIEFLTFAFSGNTGKVHFAVGTAGDSAIKSLNTNPDVDLDFNPSADFNTWGFEITPTQIRWYVKKKGSTVEKTLLIYVYKTPNTFITKKYQLKFNNWSAKPVEPYRLQGIWVHGPPTSGVTANYQVDWIKFYQYIPGSYTSAQGDFDGNGFFQIADIQKMISVILKTDTEAADRAMADMNNDQVVNITDLQNLISEVLKAPQNFW